MKVVLIAVAVVALVAGLIFGGVIKVPGVNDKPKHGHKPRGKGSDQTTEGDKPSAEADKSAADALVKPEPKPETAKTAKKEDKPSTPVTPKPPKPAIDEAKGDKKLASIFNEMDATKIQEIVEKWTDEDLARLLSVMDDAKVVEVLGKLKPERASSLAKQIQKISSVVPEKAA